MGYCFWLLLAVTAQLVCCGKRLYRQRWSGQTVLGYIKTCVPAVSCWQLSFLVTLPGNANANMLSISGEEVNRIQLINQAPRNKTL